jgi:hypothetical protein
MWAFAKSGYLSAHPGYFVAAGNDVMSESSNLGDAHELDANG